MFISRFSSGIFSCIDLFFVDGYGSSFIEHRLSTDFPQISVENDNLVGGTTTDNFLDFISYESSYLMTSGPLPLE